MNINKSDAKKILGLIVYQTPTAGYLKLMPMDKRYRVLAVKIARQYPDLLEPRHIKSMFKDWYLAHEA